MNKQDLYALMAEVEEAREEFVAAIESVSSGFSPMDVITGKVDVSGLMVAWVRFGTSYENIISALLSAEIERAPDGVCDG